MKVYYSETHRKHEPPFEVFDGGLRTPYMENPDRMDRILNALTRNGLGGDCRTKGFWTRPDLRGA